MSIVTLLFATVAAAAGIQPESNRFQDCAECPAMVIVPPGRFLMGSRADDSEADVGRGETPQVAIRIERPFALGRTEVTVREFAAFVADTGRSLAADCAAPLAPDLPAGCVSWFDATEYAAWLSRRTGAR